MSNDKLTKVLSIGLATGMASLATTAAIAEGVTAGYAPYEVSIASIADAGMAGQANQSVVLVSSGYVRG